MIKNFINSKPTADKEMRKRSVKRRLKALIKPNPLDLSLRNKKKAIILGVADYRNLGDHAIGYAQRKFLEQTLEGSDYTIVEIPSGVSADHIKRIINDEDIIFFTGGGNLGTKYEFLSFTYLPIISAFPNNKKLFFPQSYTFNPTGDSERYMRHVMRVFSKSGKNLTIVARETKSFAKFKATFPKNNVILTPDIVLSLDETKDDVEPSGITFMMRTDSEKVLTPEKQDALIKSVSHLDTIYHEDTVINELVKLDKRQAVLFDKWSKVRSSRLIITDRLHGMIFAQITGTPCIVFDNYNNKIKMTCEDWLKDKENIVFIEPTKNVDSDQILKIANKLLSTTVDKFDIDNKYKPLSNAIHNMTMA